MSQQQPTILIIDDCPEDRETYRRYLLQDAKYTYRILEEESGEEALELCRILKPDSILLDLRLPDMDGLEFLSELKALDLGSCVPVVMLTAYGNESVAVQAMKNGAKDYLSKDKITSENLRLTIHNLLENAHLNRGLIQTQERFYASVEQMLDCFGIYTAIRDETHQIVDFRVDYVNAAACANNGMTKDEQIGQRLCKLLPGYRESGLFDEYCWVVETGQSLYKEWLIYEEISHQQCLSRAFDIRATKLGDGLVACWREVTERKQQEEVLRQSLRFIKQLADTMPGILYVCDIQERQNIYVNPQIVEMLGYTPQAIQEMGNRLFEELMHPEDLARLSAHFKRFSEQSREGAIAEFEYRMRHANGEWRWLCSRDTLFSTNPDGSPRQMLGTAVDITERKRIESERTQLLVREQEAREQAEAANRSKDLFLAIVSHELRSPLNAILGWVQLLRTRKINENAIALALEAIERNAQSQAQLIEDLLDISRLVQGQLRLNLLPVDLNFAIATALETVRLTAEAKNIQIQTQMAPAIGLVLGDLHRLQQVLWNLLSNAVKFTPPRGLVEVRLERMEQGQMSDRPYPPYAQITIRDTGKGISAELLPHIFQLFRQGDSQITQSNNGLGLGLALVRQLVEMHHGTVEAASDGEGQGATFTVKLPLLS